MATAFKAAAGSGVLPPPPPQEPQQQQQQQQQQGAGRAEIVSEPAVHQAVPQPEATIMAVQQQGKQVNEPKNAAQVAKLQRCGRWTPDEKLLFLHGLRIFGRGRWKKIRQYLPTRTLIQIKSHAQKVLKREEAGEDIFAPLVMNKRKIGELIHDSSKLFEAVETTPNSQKRGTMAKEAAKKMMTTKDKPTDVLAAAALMDLGGVASEDNKTGTSNAATTVQVEKAKKQPGNPDRLIHLPIVSPLK